MVNGFYDEMINSELGKMIPDDVKGVNWVVAEAPATTEYVFSRQFLLLPCHRVNCVLLLRRIRILKKRNVVVWTTSARPID
jgi:hypothetical protein